MKISHTFYERHITTLELGHLHIVSENEILDPIADAMMDAAEILYHQYGAGRLGQQGEQIGASIWIQYLPKIDNTVRENVVLAETNQQIYLVNPIEMTMFLQSHPHYSFDMFLMTDALHTQLYHLLRSEKNKSLDDMIMSTSEQAGLLYGIITDRGNNICATENMESSCA